MVHEIEKMADIINHLRSQKEEDNSVDPENLKKAQELEDALPKSAESIFGITSEDVDLLSKEIKEECKALTDLEL